MTATQTPTKRKTAQTKRSGRSNKSDRAPRRGSPRTGAEERAKRTRAAGEKAVLDKIREMPDADRSMAKRIHEIVTTTAPQLVPKTWYGMPGYANEDGKVICYFTPAAKFKERYATLGFNAEAKLDDGRMWATSWALTELTATEQKKIASLVKKAVG